MLDPGSYMSWDTTMVDPNPGPEYRHELAAAREKSGVDESVLTGEGLIRAAGLQPSLVSSVSWPAPSGWPPRNAS
ncbi:acetyl-CoA carboxylase beta subunit [Arthrobacter pascens]|nr:acetyl-CoA carboxylase beta subunit [Arthrobacter pascens]